MSKLAADEGAINLSQGYPDFDGPPLLLERVSHYLTNGYNQYPPMAGIEPLRAAIANKVRTLYGVAVDPETEVTVTSGATEALFCAVTAVIQPGDEAIVFDPCYDSYEPAVTLAGGTCRHIPLCAPDFRIDWNRVADAIGPKTRLIMTNTPHNPTGAVWGPADIDGLRSVATGHDLYVVADEVYEHIVFDGRPHLSLTRYPDLYARSFVVSSFGKTYHTTGWKVAYCVAPPELTAEFRRIHQFVTFTTATPLQYGIADFLEQCPEHHENLASFYQAKRDLFCNFLTGSRFKLAPSAGTFFQLLDYGAITNEADTELAKRWTREEKIASIPVSVFYREPPRQEFLRFCFAKDDATLARAAEILCRL
ncbi:MAG: methionine aminotransferase [Gammaproteobacteria bacterium]|nr:methionine aminotransferase [Gammaproteobacteria bacterium]MDE0442503.1 methionine aminotransferase [Gammaproteobacteria bacterium]